MKTVTLTGIEPGPYPFSLPVIRLLADVPLVLEQPVTLVLGENGVGKSTLIEAVACCASLPVIGSASTALDPTLSDARALSRMLRLSWARKTNRGFFFRAEDYFSFVKQVDADREQYRIALERIDADESLNEVQRLDTRRTYASSYAALAGRYGDAGLDVMSHGEAFMALFQSRLVPNGLYLLDEPEAALAPTRCLALLALIKQFAEGEGCQFLIATHSPILMAIPGAQRLLIDDEGIREISYDEIPHVQFMRAFLRSPERFLRHL